LYAILHRSESRREYARTPRSLAPLFATFEIAAADACIKQTYIRNCIVNWNKDVGVVKNRAQKVVRLNPWIADVKFNGFAFAVYF